MPALKLSPSLNLLVFYLFFIGWQIPNPYLFFLSLCNGPNFFLLLFTDLEGLPIRSLFSGHRILSVYGELDLLSLEEPSDEAQLPVNPTISCLLHFSVARLFFSLSASLPIFYSERSEQGISRNTGTLHILGGWQ